MNNLHTDAEIAWQFSSVPCECDVAPPRNWHRKTPHPSIRRAAGERGAARLRDLVGNHRVVSRRPNSCSESDRAPYLVVHRRRPTLTTHFFCPHQRFSRG